MSFVFSMIINALEFVRFFTIIFHHFFFYFSKIQSIFFLFFPDFPVLQLMKFLRRSSKKYVTGCSRKNSKAFVNFKSHLHLFDVKPSNTKPASKRGTHSVTIFVLFFSWAIIFFLFFLLIFRTVMYISKWFLVSFKQYLHF